MARKKRSAFDDIVEIIARLPWWVGLLLAVVSYFGLHALTITPPSTTPAIPGQIGDIIVAQMFYMMAFYGQYLLPAIFTVGALVSILRRHKRTQLYQNVSHAPNQKALEHLTWHEFELLIGEWFRHQGYTVVETGGVGEPDGGVDLVLSKQNQTYLVQCKHWKAVQVGVNVVRELMGVIAVQNATGGFVITSGRFSDEARRFADQAQITLIDGHQLRRLLRQHSKISTISPAAQNIPVSPETAPICPKCGATMVLRTASKGANAGRSFWGCSQFPVCRATRPI
ncbi:restriction system protein [Allochromatium warmingii]|uniref:Restriction system protein n=1 Tax=Allochromatium warmingii TaxID=61595 RepID=A0A1H3DC53_ALLWA|nr:restriction endonuclease [Allochromatium warmingii]SDX63900.1 restriction system protein [Allochromatium warmingii]